LSFVHFVSPFLFGLDLDGSNWFHLLSAKGQSLNFGSSSSFSLRKIVSYGSFPFISSESDLSLTLQFSHVIGDGDSELHEEVTVRHTGMVSDEIKDCIGAQHGSPPLRSFKKTSLHFL
jgi:hypothetical protein